MTEIDTNGDGVLSAEEFGIALRKKIALLQ